MPRVAFTDLLFSWPPNGGADIDLFHVLSHLLGLGVDVKLFYPRIEGADDRGVVDTAALPFPAGAVVFERGAFTPAKLAKRFRVAVDAFAPDAVFATHAFSMKPCLIEALAHLPLVSRYYAHELTCARDPRRFRDGAACPNDYLNTPDICRVCAAESQREFIHAGNHRAWTADYLAARAFEPAHHALTLRTLKLAKALVVYNQSLREELLPFHSNIHVIPGGADVGALSPAPLIERDVKTILMAGRADDPLKGLAVLNEAGRGLWEKRQDFQMLVTHYDHAIQTPWLKCVGWRDHAGAMALYRDADIVAAPSVWNEPFGLVAVEAMANARPVAASRCGGLADIVRHGETGLLSEPGDAAALAENLSMLLDSGELRRTYGEAGRRVAEAEYDWRGVVERSYLPLIKEVTA